MNAMVLIAMLLFAPISTAAPRAGSGGTTFSASGSSSGSSTGGDYGLPARTQKVIAEDTRWTALLRDRAPLAAVGQIQVQVIDKSEPGGAIVYRGSGVLIGPRTVLTAAHVILPNGSKPDEMVFIPGKRFNSEPFGRVQIVGIAVEEGYLPDLDDDHDLAVLTLADAIGGATGFMPYRAAAESELHDEGAWVAGYPLDDDANTALALSFGRIRSPVRSLSLLHDIDATPGESGGPLLVARFPYHDPVVIGLHTGSAVGDDVLFNFGVPLTAERVKWIEGVIDADASDGDAAICNPATTICIPPLCGAGAVLPLMMVLALTAFRGRR